MKNIFRMICLLTSTLSGCSFSSGPDQDSMRDISLCVKKIDFSKIAFFEPSSGMNDEKWRLINQVFPIGVHDTEPSPVPYHASDDDSRLANLKAALYGKKKYLWATRGGYGSARLLDGALALEKKKMRVPKVFIGYSDTTFFHLLFNQWGWKTIHGSTPSGLLRTDLDCKNFSLIEKILSTEEGDLSYKNIMPLNRNAEQSKMIEGELIGGNLTLLANSLGTLWHLNGKNKIIFIEDVGSKGYVVDRDLTHLKQAGVFDEAKAVLLGSFVEGDEHVEYALKRFAEDLALPVFQADYFGHGPKNYPLPFGFLSRVSRDQQSALFNLEVHYSF